MKALFVCIESTGRSQMAEGFARAYGIEAASAGTMPVTELNPVVVAVMRERGINISAGKPKVLTEKMVEDADFVVTMGCRVENVCSRPLIVRMEKKLVDWQIEDPKGKPIEEVRAIRSQIESNVLELLKKTQ